MTVEHTPLPWKAHGTFIHDTREHALSQHPGKTMCIASVTYNPPGWEATALADARLIVRAVNAHADLLAACEYVEIALFDGTTHDQILEVISAAIINAYGLPADTTDQQMRQVRDGTLIYHHGIWEMPRGAP